MIDLSLLKFSTIAVGALIITHSSALTAPFEREQLLKKWQQVEIKSERAFLELISKNSVGLNDAQTRALIQDSFALAIQSFSQLPVAQGRNNDQQGEWEVTSVSVAPSTENGIEITQGQNLGTIRKLNGETVEVKASVNGKLSTTIKPVGTKLPYGESMAEILVSPTDFLIALTLTISNSNPLQMLNAAAYAAELNPSLSPELAKALALTYPEQTYAIAKAIVSSAPSSTKEVLAALGVDSLQALNVASNEGFDGGSQNQGTMSAPPLPGGFGGGGGGSGGGYMYNP